MIKINLLPQKRAKRAGRAAVGRTPSTDSGTKHLLIGVFALFGTAALVFLVIDMPKRNALADTKAEQSTLQRQISTKENDPKLDLKSYDQMVQAEKDAVIKVQSINRLLDNRVVPANVLHELGQILTVRGPTMSERMAKAVEKDPNKFFQKDWDPTHVWISGFKDVLGVFTLEGGAQSKEDVTQLAKRLAASVYFADVTPAGGERVTDRESGLSYYKFTVTGRLVY